MMNSHIEGPTSRSPEISRRTAAKLGLGAFIAGVATGAFVREVLPGFGLAEDERQDQLKMPDTESSIDEEQSIDLWQQFMDEYSPYAQEVESRYGVPHEVVLAMAMKESGYGQSDLATEACNFHGMKDNDEWDGEVYSKTTKEHVSEEELANYNYTEKPIPLGDGMYEIAIEARFKKFDSKQAGFMGFGEHLRNRFAGSAYKDAFMHTDPYKFARALFDTVGARWATDINYIRDLTGTLNELTGKDQLLSSGVIDMPQWHELNATQRRQLGNEDEYRDCVDQLLLVQPTTSAYELFMNNVKDRSAEVSAINGSDDMFPSRFSLVESPRITLHYTAWPEDAWGHDGIKFMQSVINHRENMGVTASANLYLGRDGKTLEILTRPGRAAYHAGRQVDGVPHYSAESVGIEVPAGKQSDITPEMYEGLVYTIVRQYRLAYPDVQPSVQDMRRFVIGHGEIAELQPEVTSHYDFPRVIADALADLSWQLLQAE